MLILILLFFFLFFNSFFFKLLISQLIVIFSLTFPPPFYLFIFPLLSTLISLFLYSFTFLNFLHFLFPSSYCKSTILFSILFIIFFTHKMFSLSLSLSLSHFLWILLYFSFISTLGWWIFVLLGTLIWVDVIKFFFF